MFDHLAEREQLLLLDNMEQLSGAAALVAELLSRRPRLTALATSRAALRVRGEQEYPVLPLAFPALAPGVGAARALASKAVALFVDRAAAVQSGFMLIEPRFTLLETIREYGLERLTACGEAEVTQERHTDYYLALVEMGHPRHELSARGKARSRSP